MVQDRPTRHYSFDHMPGTLFVVATPIGNLEDLTFRAPRTLREVDLIAAEDTRRTAKLLAHYEIRKSMVSLRQHNETRETPRLIERLVAGASIALVSDAGTPTISDPGATLVRAAHERGLRVVPIPGPSAVAAVLSVSGARGDQFVFMGFPPSSGEARDRWFHQIGRESRVVVFFEAPHRIRRTLSELDEYVKRPIIIGRELTKAREQLVVKTNTSDLYYISDIGEFACVVFSRDILAAQTIDYKYVTELFGQITFSPEIDDELGLKIVSQHLDIPISKVRTIVKKARIEAKKKQSLLP
jgi:16S rRNA (cytidine1402-2'-O)-methyltransferase